MRSSFCVVLLETPSPSGYEQPVQKIVRQYVAGFADSVTTDVHGNVIAARNPEAPLRVMLAGHCDQIGFVVQYIDDEGFLYVQPIGGWDPIGARRPEADRLDGRRADLRRHRPQADPPAHRGRAQASAEAQGPVDRHRRRGQGRSRRAGPRRRSGDARAWASRRCATASPARRRWTTRPACGSRSRPCVAPAPRNSTVRCLPSRPCRKRSACAAPRPAPTASIRTSASPST